MLYVCCLLVAETLFIFRFLLKLDKWVRTLLTLSATVLFIFWLWCAKMSSLGCNRSLITLTFRMRCPPGYGQFCAKVMRNTRSISKGGGEALELLFTMLAYTTEFMETIII